MKVRWTIEHGFGDDAEGTVYLALVDEDGDDIGGTASPYPTEAAAKADAEQSASTCDATLTWKPAPQAWQPDTYLVSNFYNDPGWNR